MNVAGPSDVRRDVVSFYGIYRLGPTVGSVPSIARSESNVWVLFMTRLTSMGKYLRNGAIFMDCQLQLADNEIVFLRVTLDSTNEERHE